MVQGSNLGGGKIFHTRPDQPWGPASLLYNGYRVSFLWVKRRRHGIHHPCPFSTCIKNEWGYTSTPPLGVYGLLRVNFNFVNLPVNREFQIIPLWIKQFLLSVVIFLSFSYIL
jgi:hypothetical protein